MDKYISIDNLYKQEDIYQADKVYIQEKLDGSSHRIAWEENKLLIGGRNHLFLEASSEEEYKEGEVNKLDGFGFTNWLRENHPNLFTLVSNYQHSFTLYGEFFGKRILPRIDYGVEKAFRTFDLKLGLDWGSLSQLNYVSENLGFLTVPLLYEGKPSLEIFKTYYDIESTVGRQLGATKVPNTCEGIVIKTSNPTIKNRFGERVIVKYKNESFSEVMRHTPKEAVDPKDMQAARDFVATYVTPTRLEHVIQQLFEEGIVCDSVKQTGQVIKQMQLDLEKEAGEEIEKVGRKDALKFSGSEAALLYKKLLCI